MLKGGGILFININVKLISQIQTQEQGYLVGGMVYAIWNRQRRVLKY